jgi:hypothetical protein
MRKKKKLTTSEVAKVANRARNAALTPEERSEISRRGGIARWANLTPKQRRELAARGGAAKKGFTKSKRK